MPFLASEGCFWPLTASNTSCYNTKNCEQIQWHQIFYNMCGLAMMLPISTFNYHVSY